VAPLDGNALQPLATGLTWTYTVTTADATDPNAPASYLIAVVGSETVGAEHAWLIESSAGTAYPSRVVAVVRDGDVWALAIDALQAGAWQRTTLPAAQLFQPGPRELSWTSDFSAGPEVFRFKAEYAQRPSGDMTVFGTVRPLWLVEGTVHFDQTTSYREVDTYAEGVGPVSFSTFFEGGGQRSDLRSFGTELPALNGRWAGALDGEDLSLEIGPDGAGLAFGLADATTVGSWTVSDADLSFTFTRDGAVQAVRLSRVPWGLAGTVAGPGNRSRVIEFRRDDRPPADPTPVPGSSVLMPGG
jgi:hypothetical protein